jgi:hypothetical protein
MQIEDVLTPLVDAAVEAALVARQEPQGFLDVAGAARFLSLSEEAVRTLAKRHRLPRVTLPNGRVRFEVEALRGWAKGDAT